MYKLFSLLFVALIFSVSASAQWSKGFKTNELSLSFGYYSNVSIIESMTDINVTSLSKSVGYVYTSDDLNTVGSTTFQFLHRNRKWLSVGIALSYQLATVECFEQNRKNEITDLGKLTIHYVGAMPTLRVNWMIRRNVTLYSKVAAGLTFVIDKYKDTSGKGDIVEPAKKHYAAFQLSPIGAQFGSKSVVGFIEAGYGNQGLVQAGAAYKFGY
jgi:hypothetical protein